MSDIAPGVHYKNSTEPAKQIRAETPALIGAFRAADTIFLNGYDISRGDQGSDNDSISLHGSINGINYKLNLDQRGAVANMTAYDPKTDSGATLQPNAIAQSSTFGMHGTDTLTRAAALSVNFSRLSQHGVGPKVSI